MWGDEKKNKKMGQKEKKEKKIRETPFSGGGGGTWEAFCTLVPRHSIEVVLKRV